MNRNTVPWRYRILAVLSPLALLALWAVVTMQELVTPILLPPPLAVLAALKDMVVEGYSGVDLGTHVVSSLRRAGIAFVAGAVCGTVVGLLRGRVVEIDALFLVPSEIVRPIPPLGLIPLFILWFGIGETSKILLMFLSIFLITMVNAQAGARACGLDTLRAAQSMGASGWQTFRFVVFPTALPQIMTGLRVAMGTGLTILVAAELLGGDRGLGFLILDASSFFRTTYVFAGIILIGLIGFVSDLVLVALRGRIIHWEGKR